MTDLGELLSVNVGRPQLVMRNGEPVSTAIFKRPVSGSVMLRTLNLDGDKQADLTVHGGLTKAVYVYPSEHYAYWESEFPEMDMPPGVFGENFTTAGVSESETYIGDKFQIGDALVMVTEPRLPCFKLGIRFGRSDVIRKFLVSERTGFYCSVLKEGEVGAGDRIHLIERNQQRVRVLDITRLYTSEKGNSELLRLAIELEALPESWKEYFRRNLAKLTYS